MSSGLLRSMRRMRLLERAMTRTLFAAWPATNTSGWTSNWSWTGWTSKMGRAASARSVPTSPAAKPLDGSSAIVGLWFRRSAWWSFEGKERAGGQARLVLCNVDVASWGSDGGLDAGCGMRSVEAQLRSSQCVICSCVWQGKLPTKGHQHWSLAGRLPLKTNQHMLDRNWMSTSLDHKAWPIPAIQP